MFSNKLIQSFQGLNRKEMTRFYEFVHSPYFNKHEEVKSLVAHFNNLYPRFLEKTCERKKLYKNVFPNQKHNQKHLALLFTYTWRLLNQFLIQEQFKKNEIQQNIFLLQSLRKNGSHRNYEKLLSEVERNLVKSKIQNSDFSFQQFLVKSEAERFHTQLEKHETDWSIQQKQNHLDHFYFSEKLKDACEMMMRSKILQVEYSYQMLDDILEEIENNIERYEQIPSIIIYYQVFQMMTKGTSEFYQDLIPILKKYESSFPKEELESIYNHLQHFCMTKINTGDDNYLNKLFQLYKMQLEAELLIENNYLSEWHYKNIVTVALRLDELDWVKIFIEDYRDRLDPEVVENAYTFNLAAYYYQTEQLEKVLNLLVRVEYTDIRYRVHAKSLLLRTYYDLNEYEAFLSLTESFRQYLQRNNKISASRRDGFINLVKFAKRAFQIKNSIAISKTEKMQQELHKLLKDIELANTIFNQSWLNLKVSELENEIN
ncbi:MAG: hypothetical protein AB8H03_11620 [Saprospiraceae bacterium]